MSVPDDLEYQALIEQIEAQANRIGDLEAAMLLTEKAMLGLNEIIAAKSHSIADLIEAATALCEGVEQRPLGLFSKLLDAIDKAAGRT